MRDFYRIRGVHCERGLTIGYGCNNCASESFSATVNGMLLNISDNRRIELGYLLITKGKKALVDEIKRILRSARIKAQYCTYGYYVKGSPQAFYHISGLTARADSLKDKFLVYKEVKQYFRKLDWKVHTSTSARLGTAYKPESIKKDFTELDPDGLLRINLIYEDNLLIPLPEKKAERRNSCHGQCS